MEFVNDESFDNYVEKYKKLTLNDKKKIVEEKIAELLLVLQKANENHGIEAKMLINKEISDIKKENATEDDFIEAMFVYVCSIQELFASYVEFVEGR